MNIDSSVCGAINPKLLSALGLCRKAGRLIFGTPLICDALKSVKKPFLVIAASDNSPNTAKRLHDRCAFYSVELEELPVSGDALAHAIGKSGKISAVAITDANLCRLVKNAMQVK